MGAKQRKQSQLKLHILFAYLLSMHFSLAGGQCSLTDISRDANVVMVYPFIEDEDIDTVPNNQIVVVECAGEDSEADAETKPSTDAETKPSTDAETKPSTEAEKKAKADPEAEKKAKDDSKTMDAEAENPEIAPTLKEKIAPTPNGETQKRSGAAERLVLNIKGVDYGQEALVCKGQRFQFQNAEIRREEITCARKTLAQAQLCDANALGAELQTPNRRHFALYREGEVAPTICALCNTRSAFRCRAGAWQMLGDDGRVRERGGFCMPSSLNPDTVLSLAVGAVVLVVAGLALGVYLFKRRANARKRE